MINLKKNNISTTSLVVERIGASDRNIVMHFKETQLVGINYWQGDFDTELLIDFLDLDHNLYNFLYQKFIECELWEKYEEFRFVHNSPDYWDILEWIDNCIWDYVGIIVTIEDLEYKIEQLQLEVKQLKEKL